MSKTYIQYKEQIQSQLQGHRMSLFLVLFITSIIISGCSYGLQFLFGSSSMLFVLVDFIFFIGKLCSIIPVYQTCKK